MIRQNYIRDLLTMKLSRVEDGILQFSNTGPMKHLDVREEVRAVGD
jgi:hypothetical protein